MGARKSSPHISSRVRAVRGPYCDGSNLSLIWALWGGCLSSSCRHSRSNSAQRGREHPQLSPPLLIVPIAHTPLCSYGDHPIDLWPVVLERQERAGGYCKAIFGRQFDGSMLERPRACSGEAHLVINVDRLYASICGSQSGRCRCELGQGIPLASWGAGRVLTDQMRKWLFRSSSGSDLGLVEGVDLVARAVAAPGDIITAASEPA
jgi:hypothetical protein